MAEDKDQAPPPSVGFVATSGRVAEQIVTGFGGAPSLLLIVILNITMIITGGYFLMRQDELRVGLIQKHLEFISKEREDMTDMIKACILETAPLRAQKENSETALDEYLPQHSAARH